MAEDSDGKGLDQDLSASDSGLPTPLTRAQYLEQIAEQVAKLEAQANRAAPAAPPPAASGNKLGARKHASFKAISTAPSINWTPVGATKVPLPYPTVQDLSNSMSTASTVNFNGSPVYLLDQTKQPNGTGDERGTAKGIRSGTVTGEVKPVSGCRTVRIEGKQVVREGDKCTMNGGNNPGIYVTVAEPDDTSTASSTLLPAEAAHIAAKLSQLQAPANIFYGRKLSTTTQLDKKFPLGQRLEPFGPSGNSGLQRTRNSLEIALLGIHGVFGAIARLTGRDEETVSRANEIGAATLSLEVAASPALARDRALTGSVTGSRGAGVRIRGRQHSKQEDPDFVYHATTSPANAQNTVNGIDPRRLGDNNRFGAAFYVAVQPETALAELAHWKAIPTTGIRFLVDKGALRTLDLTNPRIAAKYGYEGGAMGPQTQAIKNVALKDGYNAIRYRSERAQGGINYAIIADHNEVLKPVGISPIQ